MGYSFAAGTIDGPGSFSFRQGTTSANPMWNVVRNLLATPTNEDIKCHGAKPILLATGHVSSSILIVNNEILVGTCLSYTFFHDLSQLLTDTALNTIYHTFLKLIK